MPCSFHAAATLAVIVAVALVGAAEAKMRGFNFNGYAQGPNSFTVPPEATYGRVMDVSWAGIDAIGAPWWGHLNPAPGVYNWTSLDLIVGTMLKENPGLCLVFPIWGTPTWLARDPNSCPREPGNQCFSLVFQSFPGCNSLPKDIQPWRDFITALVTRYSVQQNIFYAYEIWNEPTNLMFMNNTNYGKKEWEFLAQMHYEAHDIIKSLTKDVIKSPCLLSSDPSLIGAYVLGSSLIFDNNTHMAKKAEEVLQGLVDYKADSKLSYWPVDAMTCHVYDTHVYDQTNMANVQVAGENWGLLLDQCCKMLKDYSMPHPDQPWITELGFSVDQSVPQYDGAFAYNLVHETYYEAWNRGNPPRNIDNLFWYSWNLQRGGIVFNENGGTPSQGFQGVIDFAP